MRFPLLTVVGLAMATVIGAARLTAQDTTGTAAGVSVRLTYDARTRPTLLIPRVPGSLGDSLTAILRRDLDFGDRVTIGDTAVADAVVGANGVDYGAAARAGAAGVVRATVSGGILHLALYDVSARRLTATHDTALPGDDLGPEWRLSAHAAADEAERWATGVRGIAASRVLFVREGRIWSVDSDGENLRALTGPGALSPAWIPSGRGFVHSTLSADGAQQIVARVYDGARAGTPRTVAAGGVLNLTPTVSPDGHTVAYAHGDEDGTDVYEVDFEDPSTPRRVTVGHGTDNVSPTYAPDGRRIAFTSGRSGHPEVYIADADGTNTELLTDFDFSSRNYRSNPSWSPDGRLVAFQSLVNGRFQLCTIAVRGRTAHCLATAERTEDPSWAPDSRHLVATAPRGTPRLVVLDVETGRARTLVTRHAPRMPAWSPSLR